MKPGEEARLAQAADWGVRVRQATWPHLVTTARGCPPRAFARGVAFSPQNGTHPPTEPSCCQARAAALRGSRGETPAPRSSALAQPLPGLHHAGFSRHPRLVQIPPGRLSPLGTPWGGSHGRSMTPAKLTPSAGGPRSTHPRASSSPPQIDSWTPQPSQQFLPCGLFSGPRSGPALEPPVPPQMWT